MSEPENLLPLEDAQARLLRLAGPLVEERVPVKAALGRALARGVEAVRTLPPWDNSAMDGYAVRAEDTTAGAATLRVVERIYAGQRPSRRIGPGECSRIMTGAPLPAGADAVVMQERTRVPAPDRVEILATASPGQFVRARGEDARAGEPLLPAGAPLGLAEAALLWAQGITEVPVPRRPRVAVLSNGDELATPEEATADRIVDTNGPTLCAALERAGAEATFLGIARDDAADLRARLEPTVDGAFDVVLCSAGVSVGEKDLVRGVLESLGVSLDFWKVAIKPGKPLTVGRRGQTVYLGLPGNPASSLVGFELFVRPLLRRLLGHAQPLPTLVSGRVEVPLSKTAGLTHLVRVESFWRDGDLWARPLTQQTSGFVRSTVSATHLLMFASGEERLAAGERVRLLPVLWGA